MAKQNNPYICTNCSYQTVKWLGCCPQCHEWESFSQKHITHVTGAAHATHSTPVQLHTLDSIPLNSTHRILSNIDEWDRVFGGGIVPGSFSMISGDPGIGKSTLLLQIAHVLSKNIKVIYFSSEESLEQVKSRAERLQLTTDSSHSILFSDQAVLDTIISTCIDQKPTVVIIDSIQNCSTADKQSFPGTVAQLREAAFSLMRLAKEHRIAIILSGHITKEGILAGPKTVEHMVDAVFYLQGEERLNTRVLRAQKNRFGSIQEVGFFDMQSTGLYQAPHLNEHLVQEASQAPGSVLVSSREGLRPLLLEVQALTIASKFGTPQRVITGIDPKHVTIISAVLEKYTHVKLSTQDIFVKVSGGFKIKDSSADLSIALALLSSYFQQQVPARSLAMGEISLTGHIVPLSGGEAHIHHAHRFGIEKLYLPPGQKAPPTPCSITRFSHVIDLMTLFALP